MNVGPLGILGSLSGTARAQAKGAESGRQEQATAMARGAEKLEEQAAKAESLGAADENEQTGDRDADGHRPWERIPSTERAVPESTGEEAPSPLAADPTGRKGKRLDLLG